MRLILLLVMFLWCSNLTADANVEPMVPWSKVQRLLEDNAKLRAAIVEAGSNLRQCSAVVEKLTDALRKENDLLESRRKLVCA